MEYSLGGSSKKVVMYKYSCHDTTIVMSDCTIVTSDHHGNIKATFTSNNCTI